MLPEVLNQGGDNGPRSVVGVTPTHRLDQLTITSPQPKVITDPHPQTKVGAGIILQQRDFFQRPDVECLQAILDRGRYRLWVVLLSRHRLHVPKAELPARGKLRPRPLAVSLTPQKREAVCRCTLPLEYSTAATAADTDPLKRCRGYSFERRLRRKGQT